MLALAVAGRASAVVGRGEIGLEADGLGAVSQRAIVVAPGTAGPAPLTVRRGVVGLEADGFRVAAHLLVKVSGLQPALEPLLGAQFPWLHGRRGTCGGLLLRYRLPRHR